MAVLVGVSGWCRLGGMTTLSEHYEQLLGLDAAWRVVDVDLSLDA